MTIINGGIPEWIPRRLFGPDPLGKPVALTTLGAPRLLDHVFMPGAAKSIWGVTYVPVEEVGGAKIPEPDNFILKDVRQWRDVIKAPDFSGVDWKEEFSKSLEARNIDRSVTAVSYDLEAGFFQTFVSFMGFSEALCAMYEEPEEVKALLRYISDFYYEINKECIAYCQPDMASILDDTATWSNPFFSLDMYREFFKPLYSRHAKLATDVGLKIDLHNCGRCEDFIDDWLDFGVGCWNPAQTSNDLIGIKKKYGNKLVITGGWDPLNELASPDVSEAAIKQSVCDTIDRLAPGGGYIFCGGYLGRRDDEVTARKNRWIAEAVDAYGAAFYRDGM
ncbi:MAG: veratrol--corrinoid protein metyltransferase [Oscillospiraceae bacterium]|nr:veratrol--corrinoid protein metyltransferase [Oscillospiraceae bacterium]